LSSVVFLIFKSLIIKSNQSGIYILDLKMSPFLSASKSFLIFNI
jgi:hypothetical protein